MNTADAMRSPDAIDVYVGQRVRAQRVAIGMSQEKLADALGLTFQQVQKYEKGTNRISCSKLVQIAKALRVHPAFFFEGLPEDGSAPLPEQHSFMTMMGSRHGMQICEVWPQVEAAGMGPLIVTVARLSVNAPGATKQAA